MKSAFDDLAHQGWPFRFTATIAITTLAVAATLASCGGDSDNDQTTVSAANRQALTGEFRENFTRPSKNPSRQPQRTLSPRQSAESGPVTFGVSEILAFEQREGNPDWRDSDLEHVRNSTWEFSEDGTVTYNTTNVRSDLYPLSGTYEVSGANVSFTAERRAQTETSTSIAQMVGSIDLSADPPVMEYGWAAGTTLAAVINGTKFGSNSKSAYAVRVALSRQ